MLLLHNTVSYPYYIIFSTRAGFVYDVFVNKTFISVTSEYHHALEAYLPINCVQYSVKKQQDMITLYYECNESAYV